MHRSPIARNAIVDFVRGQGDAGGNRSAYGDAATGVLIAGAEEQARDRNEPLIDRENDGPLLQPSR